MRYSPSYYNISVFAFIAFRNTSNEDSSRWSPRFFHSCQPALKLGPNLARLTGRPPNSERRFNRCRDKLLRYSFISVTRARSSSQRRIFITARITSLTGSPHLRPPRDPPLGANPPACRLPNPFCIKSTLFCKTICRHSPRPKVSARPGSAKKEPSTFQGCF